MQNPLEPQVAALNSARFHYVEQGEGESIVFVHGSLGDYRTWLPQVDAFSQAFHALSYSRRYHYPNPWPDEGHHYTPALHAQDLIDLIEAMRLAPVNLVGNSFGAYTSLVAAIQRPDLVRRLVLGEPPMLTWLQELPGGSAIFEDFMQHTWQPAREAFHAGDLTRGVQLFVDAVSGPSTFEHIPDAARTRMLDNARALAAETMTENYFTSVTPEQVGQLPMPVLLLKGERSPKMFHQVLDRLAQFVPHGRVETIPNTSHSIPSGNPQAYYEVVKAFLQSG